MLEATCMKRRYSIKNHRVSKTKSQNVTKRMIKTGHFFSRDLNAVTKYSKASSYRPLGHMYRMDQKYGNHCKGKRNKS